MNEALLTCSSAEGPAPGRTKRTPVYSLSWALTIVKRALESRPRGWEIIKAVTELSDPQLAYLIACSDPSWPVLRSMAQVADNWALQQVRFGPDGTFKHLTTTLMLSTLIKFGGKNAPESLKAYLTARISQLTIEEQVKRAEGEASADPDILSPPPAEQTPDGVQYVFNFG